PASPALLARFSAALALAFASLERGNSKAGVDQRSGAVRGAGGAARPPRVDGERLAAAAVARGRERPGGASAAGPDCLGRFFARAVAARARALCGPSRARRPLRRARRARRVAARRR